MASKSLPIPDGFDGLSQDEQIRYVQGLRDRIAQRPGAHPVPQSHLDLCEQRLAEHRRNPQSTESAFGALARLRRKRVP